MKDQKNIPNDYIDKSMEFLSSEVELPSKGVFYANNKDKVKIKFLTASEDDILFSPDLIKSGKVIDALLQAAVLDKDISPDDLIVGDRNAVLIELRKTGFGEIYKPGEMRCPSCNESYDPEVNLDKLKLKYLEITPDENGYFDYEFPTTKKRVKFRLLNGHDENRIAKTLSTKSKIKSKNPRFVTQRYIMQIMEMEMEDGSMTNDKIFIQDMISKIPTRDSLAFRHYIKLISPGVDFNYEFTCPHCNHIYDSEVPIDPVKLFYPDAEE